MVYPPRLGAKTLRTGRDALAWAVVFAQADLADPATAAAAQTGLRAFLEYGDTVADRGGVAHNQLAVLELPLAPRPLRALAREMGAVIDGLVALRERGRGEPPRVIFRRLGLSLSDASCLVPRRRWRGPQAPVLCWVSGPVRDVALYLLIRLLERVGSDLVRRCVVCARIYVARRAHRRYCSPRCQMRDYMRRYRAAGYQPVGRARREGGRR